VYIKHELVAQAFVHGDSLQAVLVAVIVPDEDILKRWAKSAGITFDETKVLADLCSRPEVNKHILGELTKFGKANDLKGFECVKAIHLESEPFSAQNDLLSPTFKLKRPQAAKLYKPQIDSMCVPFLSRHTKKNK
jgi:long-chain acyl-CoA synthetase